MVTFQDKSGYLFLLFCFFLILQYYVYFVFICSENIIKFSVTSPFLRSKYCKFISRWGSVSDSTQGVFTMLTRALALCLKRYIPNPYV